MTIVSGDLDPTGLAGLARGWGIGDCVVAVVHDGEIATAGVGVDAGQHAELGSISKAITGLLYEDALTRGEVDRSTPSPRRCRRWRGRRRRPSRWTPSPPTAPVSRDSPPRRHRCAARGTWRCTAATRTASRCTSSCARSR
ncbi:hypothetical protein [Litorihabitans aurantiacus]|uniref:Beta-lactamase n=1 Tax=Litorihabitans aurantiacus TaxID=1930061 RepID=A0AA37XG30_9MICO|nr:hypothetical protein [Litorihabitans aurantiacus]GMA32609.1 hypothetical protein GCM10025875_26010 [Litorihabitans aurantiacus]